MRWAIVIGIDGYGGKVSNLSAAVDDAERFYEWVIRDSGGEVPEENVQLLLGRVGDDPDGKKDEVVPTKDNIMGAINDLMRLSEGGGEALYFFFSGHGITATYANREESALAASGFDERHRDQTIAVRSIAEFFETTQFQDQFFFIDACRNKPEESTDEIGGWQIPRRRNPGQPPVQQFILYATSPGRVAKEEGWPGEAAGAFTKVLMSGLEGRGRAKAWSWERNCYEVRWEGLATYVKSQMEQQKDDLPQRAQEQIQVPQDVGSRGVLGRDRDARLASVPRRGIPELELTLALKVPSADDAVNLTVTDAAGDAVARVIGVTGASYAFKLPPKTYAVRAETSAGRSGRLPAPVDLYDDDDPPRGIEWLPEGEPEEQGEGDCRIEIASPDALAFADIRSDKGKAVGSITPGPPGYEGPPGYYRIRQLGPEPEQIGEEQSVALGPGKHDKVVLPPPPLEAHVVSLANALGGGSDQDVVIPVAGAEPVTWARPSTVVAAGLGAALNGDDAATKGLGLEVPPSTFGEQAVGVAVFAVSGSGDAKALDDLNVRVWRQGRPVPDETRSLEANGAGVAVVITDADELAPHWVSIEPKDAEPTVIAVPLLKDRLAAVVAQVDLDRVRIYQFHPLVGPAGSAMSDRLRRVEHLQRLLLGGRLEGAKDLAIAVKDEAGDDPFAGCLAGYVLLRLGGYEGLGDLADAIIGAAPKLSDAYILRGEYEAHEQNVEGSNQAFADAVSAGIPAFGEGLTRLVEGLRVSGFFHPRGALVRYIFQRHARGSMWAAFTPRAEFKPGRLVITGSDIGYEG